MFCTILGVIETQFTHTHTHYLVLCGYVVTVHAALCVLVTV